MAIEKHGSANWKGGLKDGKGLVSTQSGHLSDQPYGFNTRFEGQGGTNPEELVGAAHASCFAMALSMILGEAGMTPENIDATSTVYLEEVDDGFAVTRVHLDVEAQIPGADAAKFLEAAETAKVNCPISKLLAGAEITMDAALV
ncbi:MAG: OsmC family peroxiredoxin [Dinoroseobacter sp.]|nr:OsmC family protein [Alterinioella nitratireducens]MAN13814.1 OsmC family peroxiredoxin [Dinoroseobacter sp.]MAX73361.1 OsmC family peroxiredoxin [Nioella sp.]NPD18244.1 OsmC family protein [Alterinioella nitratireducens]|tara:strand:+ start:378 stop:809 length:432 start_codon:yes stop_codon:yes gene_type:complete